MKKVWIILCREDYTEKWLITNTTSNSPDNPSCLSIFVDRKDCLTELKELKDIFEREGFQLKSKCIEALSIGQYLL